MGIDPVMLVTTGQKMSDNDIQAVALQCRKAFSDIWEDESVDHLCIWRSVPDDDLLGDHQTVFLIHWTQRCHDTDLLPDGTVATTCLRVSLRGQYRGNYCQHGSIVAEHIALASWLEHGIPGCHVWYGGSMFNTLDLFDESARKELWEDFCRYAYADIQERRGQL